MFGAIWIGFAVVCLGEIQLLNADLGGWITFLSPLDHDAFAFLLLHAHHHPNFVKPCRRTLKSNGLFLRTHDSTII